MKLQWAVSVGRMRDTRCAHSIVGNFLDTTSLNGREDDNIKINLKETGSEGGRWMELARGHVE